MRLGGGTKSESCVNKQQRTNAADSTFKLCIDMNIVQHKACGSQVCIPFLLSLALLLCLKHRHTHTHTHTHTKAAVCFGPHHHHSALKGNGFSVMSPLLRPVYQWFPATRFMWKWSLSNQSFIPCPPSTPWGVPAWKPKAISNCWSGLIYETYKTTISPHTHRLIFTNICMHLQMSTSHKVVSLSESVQLALCGNWKTFLVVRIESQLIFCDLSWMWIYYFLTLDAWPTYTHTHTHTHTHMHPTTFQTAATVRRGVAVRHL